MVLVYILIYGIKFTSGNGLNAKLPRILSPHSLLGTCGRCVGPNHILQHFRAQLNFHQFGRSVERQLIRVRDTRHAPNQYKRSAHQRIFLLSTLRPDTKKG